MSDAVFFAETPDDADADADRDEEQEGKVDESLATRRLRHWLRGMFGGRRGAAPEPPERD